MKTALITGITGQDGSYLAEYLLSQDYQVYGLVRRTSTSNLGRIQHLIDHPNLHLESGDMTDLISLDRLVAKAHPNEVYNLAAQSFVRDSFHSPISTWDIDAMGPVRLMDCILKQGLVSFTKFYQASTSELFGEVREVPQNEETPLQPQSPYAIAKQYAYWYTKLYRQKYRMFTCNGILFNHESPRRGEEFVTRKITKAVAEIVNGRQEPLELGNINALRDWGHARDYVKAMHLMLQQPEGDDYVIASGEHHSVRDFVSYAFEHAGMPVEFIGHNENEIAVNSGGKVVMRVSAKFYRPLDVTNLLGDTRKAKDLMNWEPETSFQQLVADMVDHDLQVVKREKLQVLQGG